MKDCRKRPSCRTCCTWSRVSPLDKISIRRIRSSAPKATRTFVGPENPMMWSLCGDVCRRKPSDSACGIQNLPPSVTGRRGHQGLRGGEDGLHARQRDVSPRLRFPLARAAGVMQVDQHDDGGEQSDAQAVHGQGTNGPSLARGRHHSARTTCTASA